MMHYDVTSFTELVLVKRWLFCINVSAVKYSLSWEMIILVRKNQLLQTCFWIVRFPNPLFQEVNWGTRQGLGKSLLRRRKWPVPGWRATIGGKCVIGSRSLLPSAEVTRSVPGWWNRSMGGAPFCSGSFDTLDGGCRGRIRSNILHPGVKHPTCDKSRDVWGRFSHYIYLLPVGSRLTLNRTNRRLFWAAT